MENVVEKKSFDFAVRIVNLYKYMKSEHNEWTLSNQVLKSGTSIGANISEAENAQSNSDFVSKMSIALKETNETKYWLKLLYKTDYISDNQYESLFNDCDELYKIISSIILTSKENL